MCSPVIKWVGGKRQLMSEIKSRLPKNYNRYLEPFIGGAAVFFELGHKNSIINDFNAELTNLYSVIKNQPEDLFEDLKYHKNEKEYYYQIRALDRDIEAYQKLSDLEKASRFIYLNKNGFNGLYRVNKKGQYNVPFGDIKNPKYADKQNLINCSRLLKSTKILTGDFENIKPYINEGDFIYIDPPYVPVSLTSDFTSYTSAGFGKEDHIRLKNMCDFIDEKNAFFMLSNSETDFVKTLYSDYKIDIVQASRALNSNGKGRGKVGEVLVRNY